jgi:hypothetical protein
MSYSFVLPFSPSETPASADHGSEKEYPVVILRFPLSAAFARSAPICPLLCPKDVHEKRTMDDAIEARRLIFFAGKSILPF